MPGDDLSRSPSAGPADDPSVVAADLARQHRPDDLARSGRIRASPFRLVIFGSLVTLVGLAFVSAPPGQAAVVVGLGVVCLVVLFGLARSLRQAATAPIFWVVLGGFVLVLGASGIYLVRLIAASMPGTCEGWYSGFAWLPPAARGVPIAMVVALVLGTAAWHASGPPYRAAWGWGVVIGGALGLVLVGWAVLQVLLVAAACAIG
jgi:hypothetical protein